MSLKRYQLLFCYETELERIEGDTFHELIQELICEFDIENINEVDETYEMLCNFIYDYFDTYYLYDLKESVEIGSCTGNNNIFNNIRDGTIHFREEVKKYLYEEPSEFNSSESSKPKVRRRL